MVSYVDTDVMNERLGVERPSELLDPAGGDFESFYEQQHASQVRRAFLLVRSNEIANDVVHDAMIGVYRRWGQIDNPAAYLNRAVLNGCRDFGRREVTSAATIHRLRPNARDRAEFEILDDVLQGLPFNHRAAVVLRYYCGWSTRQIADALDCPVNSVGPYINRALARMKQELS